MGEVDLVLGPGSGSGGLLNTSAIAEALSGERRVAGVAPRFCFERGLDRDLGVRFRFISVPF